MSSKKIITLLIVAIVLVGMAYWTSKRQDVGQGVARRIGKPVLPVLQDPDRLNSMVAMKFVTGEGSAEFLKSGETWTTAQFKGYPVQFDNIRDFALSLRDLKIGQVLPASPALRQNLGLVSPLTADAGDSDPAALGTAVVFADAQGEPLINIVIGKEFRMGGEAEDPMSGGQTRGRYVAVGDDVFVVSEMFYNLPRQAKDWMESTLINIPAANIATLTVVPAEGETISLARSEGEKSELKLAEIPEGRKMSEAKVRGLVNTWNYLRFEDIADPALDEEATGLDQPLQFTARTAKGLLYTLRIGGKAGEGEDRYARLSVAKAPVATTPSVADEEVKEPAADGPGTPAPDAVDEENDGEIAEKMALWTQWTYVLPAYQVRAAFEATRDSLTEKIEEEKPPVADADAVNTEVEAVVTDAVQPDAETAD